MPLTYIATPPPGPIDPDGSFYVIFDDPEDVLEEGGLIVFQFDNGAIEGLFDGNGVTPPYGSSIIGPGKEVVVIRDGGWPQSFTLLAGGINGEAAQFVSLRYTVRQDVASGSPFAAQLAASRTVLAALTPGHTPEVPFRAVAGDLSLQEEPSASARLFEITSEDTAPLTLAMMAERTRQVKKRFVLSIRYDARLSRPELDAMLAADDDAVIARLERPPYADGVQLVTCVDSKLTRNDPFVVRSFTFEVLYVHSL